MIFRTKRIPKAKVSITPLNERWQVQAPELKIPLDLWEARTRLKVQAARVDAVIEKYLERDGQIRVKDIE